ncbi:MAG: ATP-binding protein [Sphingomonadaceae bacterium]
MSTANDLDPRHRQLLELVGEACWIIDLPAQRLSYLNRAAALQFGYRVDQPAAQALADSLLHDLPQRLARYAAGDASRRCVLRQTELPHRDGQRMPVDIESTLVTDAAGVPRALMGVVRDRSAQVALAAEQKKFASMLSHEFRTPLSTIDGAIQRLEMTGARHDEATRKRYTKIQRAVDRLLAMLDEYLSPERMASIGRQRQPDEVAPAALLASVAEQGRARRAQIRVLCDGLPAWMRCDPAGMRLTLEILLDNAIKYTAADTVIELVGKMAREGGIEFLVRDRGVGVPPEQLSRVFEKAFRGSNSAAIPGSGLGLYMARAMVEVHGGSLSALNLSESGAEFRIWLPISGRAGKSLAPESSNIDNSPDAS